MSSNNNVVKSLHPSKELELSLEKYLVIDVREPNERQQKEGYVPTSINVPLGVFTANTSKVQLQKAVPFLFSTDKPILMVCRSGRRSQAAGEIVANVVNNEVINLETGTLGWYAQNLKTDHNE